MSTQFINSPQLTQDYFNHREFRIKTLLEGKQVIHAISAVLLTVQDDP